MLRAQGIDAVSAYESGNIEVDDGRQLRHAIREGRVLVTADAKDFKPLARQTVAASTEHAGLILIPPSFDTGEFAAIAEAVLAIVRLYPQGLGGAVVYAKRARR